MPRYLRRGVSALGHTYLAITLGFKFGAVVGFEPTASRLKIERALLLLHTAILAAGAGLEPTNSGFKVRCLTVWLSGNIGGRCGNRTHKPVNPVDGLANRCATITPTFRANKKGSNHKAICLISDMLPPPIEAGASCSTTLTGRGSTGYPPVPHRSIESHAICATPAFLKSPTFSN